MKTKSVNGYILNDWKMDFNNLFLIDIDNPTNYIAVFDSNSIIKIYAWGKLKFLNVFFKNKIFPSKDEGKIFVDSIISKYDKIKSFI